MEARVDLSKKKSEIKKKEIGRENIMEQWFVKIKG